MKSRTAQDPKAKFGLRIGLDNLERPSSLLDSGAIKDGPASHANNAAVEKSSSISHGAFNYSVAEGQHSAHFYRESALNPTPVMADERPRREAPRLAPALYLPAGNRRVLQFFQRVSKELWLAKHHGHPSVTLNAESAPVDLAVRHNSVSRPSSAEFTKVPQRMAVYGTEPLLKARDRLPSPARIRTRGLEMSPKDALKAAEIRQHRFSRLVATQLRRSSQHAK
ncbi:hypothetical protein CSUB01_10073 [Colletotrichum sublineola]|uniref:Uncharacterized protein n=1 Tax=Colletotrichum sublineola TaxID=1173701 RepID=A0A066X198_COLSU|nr:hypothetical protein CSUB01_10073 [Colletotrichum sublineola]